MLLPGGDLPYPHPHWRLMADVYGRLCAHIRNVGVALFELHGG
jgi:hypothetical protein